MKLSKMKALAVVALAAGFTACSNEDKPTVQTSKVNLQLAFDADYTGPKEKLPVTIKNTTTGNTQVVYTDDKGAVAVVLEYGSYDFTLNYISTGTQKEQTLGASFLNVPIVKGEEKVTLAAKLSNSSNTWLIKEVYYGGCTNPVTDKKYFYDQYIEIYNNSDKTLYADGLCISATRDNSNSTKTNFWQKSLPSRIAALFIYQVPGDGDDYPVAPGKSIVIANQGLDHRQNSSSSVDLSKASFEWFDDNTQDVDVAEVPNMKSIFKTYNNIQILHTGGASQVFIFKADKEWAALMEEMKDQAQGPRDLFTGYSVPVRCIIDGVATGPATGNLYNPLTSAIDNGATFITKAFTSKAVRRKVKETLEDGRVILKDTNNSTDDFQTDATPAPFQIP